VVSSNSVLKHHLASGTGQPRRVTTLWLCDFFVEKYSLNSDNYIYIYI
jgi:hypothetical protein